MGYAIGSINTVSIIGAIFGDTQFKQMTVFAALFLIGSVLVTSYAVKERVLISARWVHRVALILSLTRPGILTASLEQSKSCLN